jgi:small subunit ribosomal protein S20
MPITRSAKKRLRQNEKRRVRNKSAKSYLKTIAKKIREAKEKREADELLKKAYKAYDKAASKGIIHKNNAARHKSRLTRYVKEKFGSVAAPPPPAETPPPDTTDSEEATT